MIIFIAIIAALCARASYTAFQREQPVLGWMALVISAVNAGNFAAATI